MQDLEEVRILFERIFESYERLEKTRNLDVMKSISNNLEELASHLNTIVLVAEVENIGGRALVDFLNKITMETNEIVVWISLTSKNEKVGSEILEFLFQSSMLSHLIEKLKMLYRLIF